MATTPQPAYRRDIDGLRALAVLAVVTYHAFPSVLRGGFVGVDIFFVISGYLITGILWRELDAQRFSLLHFYQRRILRIFPSLIVVLATTLALGVGLLLADELAQLGRHIAAGSVFASNWLLWSESHYFDTSAQTKPLLHLWSLAIEEQFYLLWPLLLLAMAGFDRSRASRWVWVTALLLWLLGMGLVAISSSAAFYLPVTRFAELLIGAWLATQHRQGPDRWTPRQRNVGSVVGLLALVLALLAFRSHPSFPGAWVALPILGVYAIIRSGPDAWVNRQWLGNRWMVGVGLISYPLYLWHWPLLVFPRILEGQEPSVAIRAAAVVLSVLLAYLTYRWWEQPIRHNAHPKRTVAALLSALVVLGLSGVFLHQYNGLPNRSAAQVQAQLKGDVGHHTFFDWMDQHHVTCPETTLTADVDVWEGHVRCKQTRVGPVEYAIVGDSHGEHLFPGLAENLPGNTAYYFRISPILKDNPKYASIYAHVLQSPSIHTVILTMFWEPRLVEIPGNQTLTQHLVELARMFEAAGKRVIFTNGLPWFRVDPQVCSSVRQFQFRTSALCVYDRPMHPTMQKTFAELALAMPQVTILDTYGVYCQGDRCRMNDPDAVLFRDDNHLNLIGSLRLGKIIGPAIESASMPGKP
jgi:peptidoglycan/LPS O-acetylase OafA/YrhL